LYDLSFGASSSSEKSILQTFGDLILKVRRLTGTALDTMFGGRFGIGKPALQTLLATSLDSFTSIRRSRQLYYDEEFDSEDAYRENLAKLSALIERRGEL